jgi:hypothetical protein
MDYQNPFELRSDPGTLYEGYGALPRAPDTTPQITLQDIIRMREERRRAEQAQQPGGSMLPGPSSVMNMFGGGGASAPAAAGTPAAGAPAAAAGAEAGAGAATAGGATAASGGSAAAAPAAGAGGMAGLVALPIAASAYGLWKAGDPDTWESGTMSNPWMKNNPYSYGMRGMGRSMRDPIGAYTKYLQALKTGYIDYPKKLLGKIF